jgi:hypothetical protein
MGVTLSSLTLIKTYMQHILERMKYFYISYHIFCRFRSKWIMVRCRFKCGLYLIRDMKRIQSKIRSKADNWANTHITLEICIFYAKDLRIKYAKYKL